MFRRSFALMFVLCLVANESAFGIGLFGHRRTRCPGPVTCCDPICCAVFAEDCICLQSKLVENGYNDLWSCDYYPGGCGDPTTTEHYSDTWYGHADPEPRPLDLPQACEGVGAHGCQNCNAYGGCKREKIPMPGHGCTLSTKAAAENKLATGMGLPSVSGDYYIVPHIKVLGLVRGPLHVVAVKVNPQPSDTSEGVLYFGVQTEDLKSLNGEAETYHLDFLNCQRAHRCPIGGQLVRVNFNGPGGERRSLLVWLK
jgi:hypothetical protein